MLFNLHYLIVSFFLTVFIGFPAAVSWVPLLHYGFQTIYFLAGGIIIDAVEFWGWQALVTICGMLVGLFFLWVTRAPHLLQLKPGFEPVWFLKFPLALAALIGGQVLYAQFAPPALWTGLFFTILLNAAAILLLWLSLLNEQYVFREYASVTALFVWWVLIQAAMEATFYFTYTGLDELWVALIASGVGAAVTMVAYVFYHAAVKEPTEEDEVLETYVETKLQ